VLLANGAQVNVRDDHGCTPLHWAASFNKTEVAKVLLANGAQVNVRANDGDTALALAMSSTFASSCHPRRYGCGALGNLAANNADNQVKIGAGGGVEAIVQAMGGHRGSVAIQEWSCWAPGHTEMEALLRQHGAE